MVLVCLNAGETDTDVELALQQLWSKDYLLKFSFELIVKLKR